MARPRADLGFAASLEELDLTGLSARLPSRPSPALVAEAAAATGFVSREPKPAGVEGAAPRRRRTGRSSQFNLKARPDTVAAYCALADRMGWGLGETLEHAVALLEREYGGGPG